MKTQNQKIELPKDLEAKIIKEIQDNQPTIYWDYNDSLSEDQINTILTKKDGIIDVENEIWEMNIDYICDLERETIKNALCQFENELRDKLYTDYEEYTDVVDIAYDDFMDDLRDYVEVDFDFDQLIKNTGDQVFFYDTGIYIGDYTCSMKERLKDVKQGLKIKLKDKEDDNKLEQMILDAGYGGRLVIYFNKSISYFTYISKELNTIEFSDITIAIIDNSNGSGADTYLGTSLKLPFDLDNVFHCKSTSYSYTYEVCGMYSDWCNTTNVKLLKSKSKKSIEHSSLNEHMSQEAEYRKKYQAGGCTPGDMNYTRHRNTTYINNFPCGSKCLNCGTFWID